MWVARSDLAPRVQVAVVDWIILRDEIQKAAPKGRPSFLQLKNAFDSTRILRESTLSLHETMATYHLLKIQGKAKIPDYVQLRDADFNLLAYFRLDRPEKSLVKAGLADHESRIMEFLNSIPYGKVQTLELS